MKQCQSNISAYLNHSKHPLQEKLIQHEQKNTIRYLVSNVENELSEKSFH